MEHKKPIGKLYKFFEYRRRKFRRGQRSLFAEKKTKKNSIEMDDSGNNIVDQVNIQFRSYIHIYSYIFNLEKKTGCDHTNTSQQINNFQFIFCHVYIKEFYPLQL